MLRGQPGTRFLVSEHLCGQPLPLAQAAPPNLFSLRLQETIAPR